jgi:predicted ATPase
MRIAITGAGGIGKTTLASALAQAFDVPLIEEGLQPVVNAIGKLGKADKATPQFAKLSDAYQKACTDWLKKRAEQQAVHASFVADRFAIDVLARWVLSGVKREDDELLIKLVTECRQQTAGLDLVVMPPLVRLADKDMPNEKGLKRHESMSMKLFSQSLSRGLMDQLLTVPRLYIPLSAQTTEQRVAMVKQALTRLNIPY